MNRHAKVLVALTTLIAACAAPGAAQAAPGQGFLPDNRAWELVSPPDKNGGDVMGDATRTRSSVDGDAVQFSSLTGFADIAGTGIAAEYIAERTAEAGTQGWSTHGIMPQLEPLSFTGAILNLDSLYQAELSDDLSKGVFRTLTGITNAPNVANVPNLYMRDDLLAPGAGSYSLMTDCAPVCGSPLAATNSQPFVADSTPDLGHVIFQSTQNLVAGPTGTRIKLYEWDHGVVRLAGVLPDGSVAQCTNGQSCSFAGPNVTLGRYTLNTISDDGSKIFFTVPPGTNTNGLSGGLFMRVDHTTTVQINASESSSPGEPLDATYQVASPDGARVFFTSEEQLTDTPGSGLYMYDTTRPDTDPDNLTLISVDDEPADGGAVAGVIGTSATGDTVYFIATGQLVAGEPPVNGDTGFFRWHDGVITYIGSLLGETPGDDSGTNIIPHQWNLASLPSRVSPDGDQLMFAVHNSAGLTGYNHGNTCFSTSLSGDGPCNEIYLYNADTDGLVCVSCNPSGASATGDASTTANRGVGGSGVTAHLNHPMSDDGTRIFFDTGEALLPEDRNGRKIDVYQYDVPSGELHLISSGTSDSDSSFLDASPSGKDVFFITRDRLAGWDTDSALDLYDARVGGGFPDPSPLSAACQGDACRGFPSANPPGELTRSSTRVFGPGNAATKAKQKKKTKHRKRHHKRTGQSRKGARR